MKHWRRRLLHTTVCIWYIDDHIWRVTNQLYSDKDSYRLILLQNDFPSSSLRCSINERNLTVNGRLSTVLCTWTAVFGPYLAAIQAGDLRSYSHRIFCRNHIVYWSYTVRISIKNTTVNHRPGLQRSTVQIRPYTYRMFQPGLFIKRITYWA